MSQVVGLPNNSYKPITNTAWVHVWLCKLQKGCTRLAAASDKAYQLLAHGRHDIAEILLKVAPNTKNQIKSKIFKARLCPVDDQDNIVQTWGQLHSNVIDYITIPLQFSLLHYITITSIFKCNQLNYNYFVNVIDYITDYI